MTAGACRNASGAANTAEVNRLVSSVTTTPSRRARRRHPRKTLNGRAGALTAGAQDPGRPLGNGRPAASPARETRTLNALVRAKRGMCGARISLVAMATPSEFVHFAAFRPFGRCRVVPATHAQGPRTIT